VFRPGVFVFNSDNVYPLAVLLLYVAATVVTSLAGNGCANCAEPF
jgi:hypothetical protein